MNIIALSKKAHQNAKEKGFWESDNINEKVLLIIPGVGEAVNAHRKGKRADLAQFNAVQANGDVTFSVAFESYVKDSFEDEIADCLIRACDLIGYFEFDNLPKYTNKGKDFVMEMYIAINELFTFWKMKYGNYVADKFPISYFVHAMINISENEKFDLAKHVELKMRYNEGREYKHGCKY